MVRDWIFVASLCLGRVAFGFQFQSLASMPPDRLAGLGIDYGLLGVLVGLYMLPGAVVALPGGLLGRRFGGRTVVGCGLALMSLGNLLPVLALDVHVIGAGRVLSGVGAVTLVVMQGKMLADRVPPRHFIAAMGLAVGAFPVGIGLVPMIGGAATAVLGPTGVFQVGAALSLLALLLFVPTAHRGAAPAGPGGAWVFPSWPECRLIAVAGMIWMAYNAGYYGFLSYMPALLARQDAGSTTAVMVTATWANLPATVLGGVLAARFGAGPVIVFGMLAEAVALIGPGLFGAPVAWGMLFGTVAALPAGVIVAMGTLSARPENQAVGMGVFYTLFYLGGGLLPALCGLAANRTGSPQGALVTAAGLTLFAIPFFLLHRRLAGRAA